MYCLLSVLIANIMIFYKEVIAKRKFTLKPEIESFCNGCSTRRYHGRSHKKIRDKGGIKPCNISLNITGSLCNCRRSKNQLLLEEISTEIEIEIEHAPS